jgi:hypothetical protein
MRLADDTFRLTLGNRTYALRPTLRAAFHLHQRYDGFQALFQAVSEGSFTATMDVITATSIIVPVASLRDIMRARDQLLSFLLILIGATSKGDKPETGKPIAFDEYFTRLFQIGTGWLGWTPEDTWNATPAEIINAYEGRLEMFREMLKAIYGTKSDSDDQAADVADGSLAEIKTDLNAIGDLTNHVSPR